MRPSNPVASLLQLWIWAISLFIFPILDTLQRHFNSHKKSLALKNSDLTHIYLYICNNKRKATKSGMLPFMYQQTNSEEHSFPFWLLNFLTTISVLNKVWIATFSWHQLGISHDKAVKDWQNPTTLLLTYSLKGNLLPFLPQVWLAYVHSLIKTKYLCLN